MISQNCFLVDYVSVLSIYDNWPLLNWRCLTMEDSWHVKSNLSDCISKFAPLCSISPNRHQFIITRAIEILHQTVWQCWLSLSCCSTKLVVFYFAQNRQFKTCSFLLCLKQTVQVEPPIAWTMLLANLLISRCHDSVIEACKKAY